MTAPLTDELLAEVEEFLDVWDAAPAHRAQYRDVISSQKSGDPEGGRKLRATALRELLAEVRRLAAENEQFAAQIAADANEDHVLEGRAELTRALGEERGRRGAAEAERDRLACALEAVSPRFIAAASLPSQFENLAAASANPQAAAAFRSVASLVRATLASQEAQDGPQRLQDAPRPDPATSEPSGALESPQRAAGDLRTPAEWCRVYGLDIADPDGWRTKDAPAWGDPIDLPEFQRRAGISTVNAPRGVWGRMYDDLARLNAQVEGVQDVAP